MPICEKCEREYDLDDGCEDDGLCHPCAHAMIAEAREWLESYSVGPSTDMKAALRELTRVRHAMLFGKRRCPDCGKLTRDTTAGCDHCDYEDK